MSAPDTGCTFTLSLPCSREAAFDLFVDGFGSWWPKECSASGDALQEAGIEPQLGGACYEQTRTGQRIIWGTVLSIERPLYIRIAWQIGPDRQLVADPAAASRVVAVFRELREGSTLELTHSEFLRHGVDGEAYQEAMASEKGWPYCLEALRKAAGKLAKH